MTKQIWIGAISVMRTKGTSVTFAGIPVATTQATNKQEAIGIMLGIAEEQYPRNEGWYNHQVAVDVLSDKFMMTLDS